MEKLLSGYFYFFHSHKFLRVCGVIGLLCFAVACLMAFLDPARVKPWWYACFVFLFLTPNAAAPFQLRALLSKKQYYLVPGLRLALGIGLFLQVAVMALFIPVSTALLGMTAKGFSYIDMGLFMFILAGVYNGIVQISFHSVRRTILIAWIPWGVFQLAWQFPEQTAVFLHTPWLLIPVILLCLAGWGHGLNIARKQVLFRGLGWNGANGNAPHQGEPWFDHGKLATIRTVSGTLLRGAPDGHWATLMRSAFLVVFIPSLPAILSPLIVTLVTLFNGETKYGYQPVPYIYMVFCAALTGLPPAGMGELAARTRYLWLRWGSDRLSHWRHLEFNLLRSLAYTFALVVLVSMVVLLPFADNTLVFNFPLFTLSLALFNTYLGLFTKIYRWPGFLIGVIGLVSFIFMVSSAGASLVTGNFDSVHFREGILLLLALFFRFAARRGFLEIDWMRVRPVVYKRPAG